MRGGGGGEGGCEGGGEREGVVWGTPTWRERDGRRGNLGGGGGGGGERERERESLKTDNCRNEDNCYG